MKFGYLHINNAEGIHPGKLAGELEARGFDSIWLPEHSHMPVKSAATYPDPTRSMPDAYAHMMNPFISLMAAASTTTTLKLGTGMSVGLEHDLLDLACTTATLDALSESRFILGLGVGWNAEEFQNHCSKAPFKKRYTAMKERVAALRAAWGYDQSLSEHDGLYADTDWGKQVSAFSGEYDSFTPSWVFPKPKQGNIPVALGFAGPVGIQHTANYADIWAPVDTALMRDGKMDVAGHIQSFKEKVEAEGRNPEDVKISLFSLGGETEKMVEHYATLDIERFVFGPPTFMRHSASDSLTRLDSITGYIEKYPE